jgi:hypothetical protein
VNHAIGRWSNSKSTAPLVIYWCSHLEILAELLHRDRAGGHTGRSLSFRSVSTVVRRTDERLLALLAIKRRLNSRLGFLNRSITTWARPYPSRIIQATVRLSPKTMTALGQNGWVIGFAGWSVTHLPRTKRRSEQYCLACGLDALTFAKYLEKCFGNSSGMCRFQWCCRSSRPQSDRQRSEKELTEGCQPAAMAVLLSSGAASCTEYKPLARCFPPSC